MKEQTGTIKIDVACLASYNNGILHGAWIDADQDQDEIWAGITGMLKASPVEDAEEFAIHDYEGFEGASLSEYQNIESVAEMAGFIAEYGALDGKLIEYFGDLDEAKQAMKNHNAGQNRNVAEFAQELTEETTKIPESLQYYIDYDRMAHDLGINDIITIEKRFEQVHILWRY